MIIGYYIITITGTFDECTKRAGELIFDGYEIQHEYSQIQWPFFWKKKYTLIMRKPILSKVKEWYDDLPF